MIYRRLYRSLDHTLLLAAAAVIVFGLIVIGSAKVSFSDQSFIQLTRLGFFMRLLHLDYGYVGRQFLWVVLGVAAMAVTMYIPYEDICKHSRALYVLNLIMLAAVLFAGHSAMGAQRWIGFGPVKFQPSEFSKLLMIITLANFLALREGRLNRLRDLLPAFVFVGVPMLLVLKQPDLGTSMVFVAILFGMLFFAGARPGLLLGLLGIGTVLIIGLFMVHGYLYNTDANLEKQLMTLEQQKKAATTVAARQQLEKQYDQTAGQYRVAHHRLDLFYKYTLKEYQIKRLTIFRDPQTDLMGDGYNIWQSLIAVGSGGMLGKGLLEGTQSHLTFLPERHTDFIFSVVGEEFGFLGALFLLVLFLIILYRGVQIAASARDSLGLLLATGIISMFAFHVFVNVGMTTGIMPVTGIPLPLFSYGGSNMIMNLAALGLLMNVYIHRKQILF
ncbi:rod shape-determining protein RodA [Desulfotomaculum copahuensis]|uniref:Peptidoglycan glycosyltransferase RodA n=1 Tax=Desulfotomaculum copahuensis TaxID=1838280 RepID=A0A1B7LHE0_9FIRM|nr:rod shape-determining protein RodA [Desulfotomaculum copahuensis]OAT85615.1 rod shape-determining protein RodA [Desulfotomaculum copahuensis]